MGVVTTCPSWSPRWLPETLELDGRGITNGYRGFPMAPTCPPSESYSQVLFTPVEALYLTEAEDLAQPASAAKGSW